MNIQTRGSAPQMAPVTPFNTTNGQPDAKEIRQPDKGDPSLPAEVVPEKEDQLSSKYAEFARKEKALRTHHLKLKEREDAIKAKEAQYQTSDYISKNELKQKLQDPNSWAEYGLSSEELLNLALNQPSPENKAITSLQNQIEELKQGLKSSQTQADERQQQAYNEAVSQINNEAKLLVDSDSRFETVKKLEATDAIAELIIKTHEEEKVLLSVEEAAQMVEEHLIEEGLKFAQLDKVKAKLNPPAPAVEETKHPITEKPQMKTLTNAVSAQTPTRMSEKERRERAILAFRGQLPT